MEVGSEVVADNLHVGREAVHEIDWDAYASQYDLLAKHNPSYRENIQTLRAVLKAAGISDSPSICDVGAGTGNFLCALAKDYPEARFSHIDSDIAMNEVARAKYHDAGIQRVEMKCCPAEEAQYPSGSFDVVICVNALYAIQDRRDVLRKIRLWLKPHGVFFVIDFGRRTRILDWARFILGDIVRREGVVECARFLAGSFESIRQNRRGSQGQADGVYWLHTTEEFGGALESAGFAVRRLETCYRGYCDLAVCGADPSYE